MKAGREYEAFIYDTFSNFFPDFEVKQNDKILGAESEINREIDVSIRGKVSEISILYVVQAKDHNRPADIKIIGEFASVIKDVGASKGFLICASGFAKTIKTYARKKGIELLTVEDIESEKWKARVEIPIIYRNYEMPYKLSVSIIGNECTAERNKVAVTIDLNQCTWSTDGGVSFQNADHLITTLLVESGHDLDEVTETSKVKLPLVPGLMMINVLDCPCHIEGGEVELGLTRKNYLKMVVPDEYRHIRDHLTDTALPTKFKVGGSIDINDGTWEETDYAKLPIKTDTVWVEFTLDPTPLRNRSLGTQEAGNRATRRAAKSKKNTLTG